MKHHTHRVLDIPTLSTFLVSPAIQSDAARASSILVQMFSAQTEPTLILDMVKTIKQALPESILVGTTTVGEVADGEPLFGATVVSLSFFDSARLTCFSFACSSGEEQQTGLHLGQAIQTSEREIVGVLLLATPLTINASQLLQGMMDSAIEVTVFGAGAGHYTDLEHSLVFHDEKLMEQGAIAVTFSGDDLRIESSTYLGWQALSNEKTVTEVDGKMVRRVDGAPAFEVYRRYLDIPNDDDFFLNALEFPFLLERNGEMLARVPVSVDAEGALQLVADIRQGEKFRIGYGDPAQILAKATALQQTMRDFSPQAIYLYTCVCRRHLMQHDVGLETRPFQAIAPTAGFYTYGEFYGQKGELRLMNATLVVVGLREGPVLAAESTDQEWPTDALFPDPYAERHTRVVSRLVRFIGAVTTELEQANRELKTLSVTDKLTQVYNRVKLDAVLRIELDRAIRYRTPFSIILLDIDFFKRVNDDYGHSVGDAVLVHLARVLKLAVRSTDTLGRWGGEEFLFILPQTAEEAAYQVAEKIREAVASAVFPVVNHKTVSLGVTTFQTGDNEDRLLLRADAALYEAKRAGRNCTVQKM